MGEHVQPDAIHVRRDVTERLRLIGRTGLGQLPSHVRETVNEAADEIEELRWQLRLHQPRSRP
jgi:hypothetical protein